MKTDETSWKNRARKRNLKPTRMKENYSSEIKEAAVKKRKVNVV